MKFAWILCLSTALLLPACGDDAGPQKPEDGLREYLESGRNPGNVPGGLPGGLPVNVPGLEPDGNLKPFALTDEMMEQYVGLLKDAAASGGAMPTAAMFAARKWDPVRWGKIVGMIARSQTVGHTDGMAARYEKMIADHTARLATADPEKKKLLESWIENAKQRLEAVKQAPKLTDIDRKNNELIERWLPKIRAASSSR